MTRRKAAAVPEAEPQELRPMLEVHIPRRSQFAIATVRMAGEPVDAQVRWYPGSPWRDVPAGSEARFDVPDPSKFVTRVQARRNLSVTARVLVGETQVCSDTVEVRIGEVRK